MMPPMIASAVKEEEDFNNVVRSYPLLNSTARLQIMKVFHGLHGDSSGYHFILAVDFVPVSMADTQVELEYYAESEWAIGDGEPVRQDEITSL